MTDFMQVKKMEKNYVGNTKIIQNVRYKKNEFLGRKYQDNVAKYKL